MSKARAGSSPFEEKGAFLFKHLPMPSYAWQIVENDLILIDYNNVAFEITEGRIEKYLKIKATELYKDQPEILEDLRKCVRERTNFFKEIKYKFTSVDLERYFSVNYGFIPPDIVIVHTNDITEKKQIEFQKQQLEEKLIKLTKELSIVNQELEQKYHYKSNQLLKSEEKYKIITENANDIIIVFNREFKIEYCNEKPLNQILGYKIEELIGMYGYELIHPDEKETVIAGFMKGRETGKSVVVARIRHQKGYYIWIEATGRVFTDKNGIKKDVVIVRDISDRKLAETKLLNSEFELKERVKELSALYHISKIFDISNISVDDVLYDVTNFLPAAFQYPNITCARIRYNTNEYRTINFKETDLKISIKERINEKLLTIDIYILEDKPFLEEEVYFLNDIGKRLKNFLEKKETEQYLRKSEEKYRLISENANDLIVIVSKEGIIEYVNKRPLLKNFGYSLTEIIGRKPNEFIHPDALEEGEFNIIKYLKKGKKNINARLRHKKGYFVPVEFSISLFIDAYKEPKQLVIVRNISKRQEAEQKLKESEVKYRLITENVNDLISIVNEELKYEYINENVTQEMRGFSREDRIGNSPIDILHPDDIEKAKRAILEAFEVGEGRLEVRLINRDGGYDWFDVKGKTFIDIDGKKKILLVSRDLNERKEAEKKLRESEKKYRRQFEDSPNMILLLNSSGTIIDVNPAFLLNSIHNKGELIGNNFQHISGFGTLHMPLFQEKFAELLNIGHLKPIELQVHLKDNQLKWISLQASVIDIDGVKLVQVIAQDINERKEAEQKLIESEEKYRLIAENANDMIYVLNKDYRFEYINESTLMKQMGYTSEELIGKMPLEYIHPEDIGRVRKGLRKGFGTGQGTIEVRIMDKEGKYHWVEIRGQTFIDSDGKLKALSIARDINERKIAEQQIKESEEKFRTIAEQSFLGIAIIQDNLLKYVNQKLADIFGYSIEEADTWQVGEFLNVIHPEDKQFVAKQAMKKQMGEPDAENQYQFRGIKKDGTVIWLELFSKTISYQEKLAVLGTILDITDKKLAEKALKTEKKFSEDMINTTSDTIFVFEPATGKAIRWNNSFSDVSGYTNEEIVSMKAPDSYYSEEDLEQATKAIKKISEEGEVTVEMSLISKDGRSIPFEYRARSFSTSDGRDLIVSYGRDITERKEAERQLRESKEKFRALVETTSDWIWEVDHNNIYKYVSPKAKDLLGYEPEELIGKTPFDTMLPDEKQSIREMFESIKQSKNSFTGLENICITKNGEKIVIETSGVPIFDEKGNFRGYRGIDRDITVRKKIEQKLKESEEKYRLISENVYDLIGILNQKFEYEYINEEAFISTLGYTNEEIIGTYALNYIHPEDRELALNNLAEGFKTGYGSAEVRFKHKNNQWIWIEARGKTFTGSDGDLKALIVSRDITKRKKADENLRESEEKYRDAYDQANFYKDLFAHDINNIMQVINSSAELINYYMNSPENLEEIGTIADMIKKQIAKAKILVHNVNTLSELEEGTKPIKLIEVYELVQNSAKYVRTAFQERAIDIEIESFSNRIFVQANELLQEVFDNILTNAVRYNDNSLIKILVNVSRERKDDQKYLKFELIDNGIGIEDERKRIIFKRGHRESKGQKGMGLGLSLVKKILEGFNGEIWVENRVKDDYTKGSNFILLIPEAG